MSSKVFFVKTNANEGEQTISQRARRLFKAGDFADCSHNTCILTKAGHKKTIKNCQITASADIA